MIALSMFSPSAGKAEPRKKPSRVMLSDPQHGADQAPQEEPAAVHPGHARHHRDVGADERHEPPDHQRLVAVLVEEGAGLVEVLLLEDPAVALVERRPELAADLVAGDVAAEAGDREQHQRGDQVDPGRTGEDVDVLAGDEQPHREQQGVARQEREEQPALHEDDHQAEPEQRLAEPVSSSQFGSIQSIPSRRGWSRSTMPARVPARRLVSRFVEDDARAVRPDAARAARGRRRAVGGHRGPRASSTTPSCCATATGATWSTATATGRSRRSSPTSTPAGTTSTSRSRTGSTTSTSARSSAPPTRSWPPRCTSSATAAGTAAARW